ncbi:MAG: hypothetical protein ACYCTH_04940, partial [Cellulomonas sp.]
MSGQQAQKSAVGFGSGGKHPARWRFADLAIRTRLLLVIGLLALVAVGSGVLAISSMSGMMANTEHLVMIQSDLMGPIET